MTIHIGITGSRNGARIDQFTRMKAELLRLIESPPLELDYRLHHGDCVGVDRQAFGIAKQIGYRTVAHPPTNERYRAFTRSDEILPPQPYLERDQAIVDAVSLLIVVPSGPEADNPRSGTWATYRMAVKAGVETVVIEP